MLHAGRTVGRAPVRAALADIWGRTGPSSGGSASGKSPLAPPQDDVSKFAKRRAMISGQMGNLKSAPTAAEDANSASATGVLDQEHVLFVEQTFQNEC